MYDVAVIVAGPAGATLARLIGERYRVLLVEKRDSMASPGRLSFRKCKGTLFKGERGFPVSCCRQLQS